MVGDLLETTTAAVLEICDREGRWPTKKIKRELNRFCSSTEIFAQRDRSNFSSHLTKSDRSTLRFDAPCVFCYRGAGTRRVDNYFTAWRDACGVQTGNLLYEVGLVLWAVVSALPSWADARLLETLSDARLALHHAIRAMRMMICPQCGRPTTCLGRGTSEPEADGHCRWCSDMGGGFGMRLSVKATPDGYQVEFEKRDGGAPGRNDRDLLPPEVTAVWDAIEAMAKVE
jgi:hypothetical protein